MQTRREHKFEGPEPPGAERRGLRLAFSILLALVGLFHPLAAEAQQVAKAPRIGYLSSNLSAASLLLREAFLQGLRDLGYIEGRNVVMEYRNAEGKLERLPELAADLVRLRPDVIVAGGTPALRAVQQATTTIPIVTTGAANLVEQGFVASLTHPGGNLTGVENNRPELYSKRLELLKEAVPQIVRVAFLCDCDPTAGTPLRTLSRLETDAPALGVQLLPVVVRHSDELADVFAAIVARRPDALLLEGNVFVALHRRQLMDFAITHRLPTVGPERQFPEAGALMAFGFSNRELAQRAAVYVDKILKGARPGDLPIERPMKFELVLNLKTAQALGLTIPPSVLLQADEVIK
jgi:putative tryptophan/tyrosine transport system substrate-binding protein